MSMRQLRITNSITNRESPSLEKYLQEIGKVQLISSEEEVRLANLIKKGDKEALDRLVKANLRFVVSVAKQYQGKGLSLPDLINEGNLGLIKAAERFDDTRGFKFISFAVWWIRQSILQALVSDSRMIRLPLNKVALKKRILNMNSQMEQEFGRAPSSEELAEKLEMPLEDIHRLMTMDEHHVSLDVPMSGTEEITLLDTLENTNAESTDNEVYYKQSLKTEIGRFMQLLTERQQQTICYFFGIGLDRPLSLEDIGEKFSLTPERVRQIKDKALSRLRTAKSYDLLRSYLNN
jgi:RNA polymerase primary sigma factor